MEGDGKYKNSIYAKVRRKMLIAVLLSAFTIFAIATVSIFIINVNVANASKTLGNRSADNSVTAMTKLAEESLLHTATNRAMLSDAKMLTVSHAVTVIADNATSVMSYPDRYNSRAVLPPDPADDGEVVAQAVYAGDVAPSALSRELGLLGNLQDIQIALLETEENISSMQIGTETGIMIMVDDMSAAKTSPFDPRVRPWYLAAKERDGLIWTEVFDDAFDRGLAITCGMPYYGADGRLVGVVSGGMLLETLKETVTGALEGENGVTFIVDEAGKILISEDVTKDADGNIIREDLLKSESESMRAAAEEMLTGASGIKRVTWKGKDYFMAYSPLTARPWSFVALVETEEALKPALLAERHIGDFTEKALADIRKIFFVTLAVFALLLIAIPLLGMRYSKRFSEEITSPIIALTGMARSLEDGDDLNIQIDIKTGDEVEELADAFAEMTARLKIYIEHLTIVTAEKGRIETELNVATRIQASMLPCIFPPFPECEEFDLYAIMQPAREVSGDFYDFFLIDKDTLCVIIADVSGKGVPAALFMVIAKTLIKNNAQSGLRPSEVFTVVNNLLCENNEAEMFVTAFMGYLDIPTGRFTFVNAGHNPPLLGSEGDFRLIEVRPGFVLAGLRDISYVESELTLGLGETLCMYTDGATEATNSTQELYSVRRLIRTADAKGASDIAAFVYNIKSSIEDFIGGGEQADDITLLALRYDGRPTPDIAAGGAEGEFPVEPPGGAEEELPVEPPVEPAARAQRELKIAAHTDNLSRVLAFITDPLRTQGADETHISQIEVAAEEIFVNISNYAYAPER
ncbi:MAG: SpoIIE family protein phosphatase, partial [Clostridiales Family XIII bacterium]|nr:SpoIIE family protein phosphatase [Clostridiales Family XIII bacterium]